MNFDFLLIIRVTTVYQTLREHGQNEISGCVIASNGKTCMFCFQKQDFHFDISMALCLYS